MFINRRTVVVTIGVFLGFGIGFVAGSGDACPPKGWIESYFLGPLQKWAEPESVAKEEKTNREFLRILRHHQFVPLGDCRCGRCAERVKDARTDLEYLLSSSELMRLTVNATTAIQQVGLMFAEAKGSGGFLDKTMECMKSNAKDLVKDLASYTAASILEQAWWLLFCALKNFVYLPILVFDVSALLYVRAATSFQYDDAFGRLCRQAVLGAIVVYFECSIGWALFWGTVCVFHKNYQIYKQFVAAFRLCVPKKQSREGEPPRATTESTEEGVPVTFRAGAYPPTAPTSDNFVKQPTIIGQSGQPGQQDEETGADATLEED